jgi:flagellar protein FlgJ
MEGKETAAMDMKIGSGSLDASTLRLMKEPESGFGGSSARSLSSDKTLNNKEKIASLAREFESVFMGQMIKAMRTTIPKSGLVDGGHGEEIYTSLLDEELSRRMSYSQHGGLSQALADQLNMAMERQASQSGVKESIKPGVAKTE